MATEFITGWVYKKGELTRQKMDNWIIGIAVVASLILTFTVAWPLTHTGIPFTGKINKWLLLIVFFGIAILLYYSLRFFSGSLFMLYGKIAGIKEEEIIFTNHKITSTNKTWVLNDEIKKLTKVSFTTAKDNELVFKGTATKPGKTPVNYTVTIPVPLGELRNAEKVYEYFKALQS
ncbi:hypothetical protein [Ferruginibacter sp. SUN106]|uniref:hypothetical protein n=1 Tax=Ferruginibacter sp. SUN106 TaxID=2978348 RepID=UPI003D360EB1